MKGSIAAILLIAGFIIRLIGTALVASMTVKSPDSAFHATDIVNLIAVLLWMGGSFLLAVHLRLDFLWGFAGLLFIVGLIIMYLVSPVRREQRERRKYPFDHPGYGDRDERRRRRREEDQKPRTYDY